MKTALEIKWQRAKKALMLILLAGFITSNSACNEDTLVENNPAPPVDNLKLRFIPLYNGEPISSDSMQTNDFNNRFYIDSLRFMVSDYFFTEPETNDTINDEELNLAGFATQEVKPDQRFGRIPPGDYSGYHHLVIGMDSLTVDSLLIQGNPLTEGDPDNILNNNKFKRKDKYGFDHLQIYGRLLDDFSADTAVVPLEFRLGTYLLTDTIRANNITNFGVDNKKTVLLILQIEIEPMLNSFDLAKPNNKVESDPSKIVDMELARTMMDTLKADIF